MIGRPNLEEKDYENWLRAMSQYLREGQTLNSAISKAGIEKHRTSLYKKYAQNDWFKEKIHHFQSIPSELAKNVIFKTVERHILGLLRIN